MYLKEAGRQEMERIHLAQNIGPQRLLRTRQWKLWVPQNAGNISSGYTTVSFL